MLPADQPDPVLDKIARLEAEIDALTASLPTKPLREQYQLRGQIGILLRRWRWYQTRLPILLRNRGRGAHLWKQPSSA